MIVQPNTQKQRLYLNMPDIKESYDGEYLEPRNKAQFRTFLISSIIFLIGLFLVVFIVKITHK